MLNTQESKDPATTQPSPAQPMTTEPKTQTEAKLEWLRRARSVTWVVVQHATKHTGVGIVCAVAYFDP